MREANPQTIYLKDYTVPDFLISSVDLNFNLAEENTRVISRLTLTRNPASQTGDAPLVLLGENLTLVRVIIHDDEELTETDYQLTPDSLIIHSVPQHREFVLTIENTINPKANTTKIVRTIVPLESEINFVSLVLNIFV